LHRSQWWRPEVLAEQQFRQLRELLAHAVRCVPFYSGHLRSARIFTLAGITPQSFSRWPILTRATLQRTGESLLSRSVPSSHGSFAWNSTSGSTGEPIRVACSELHALVQAAMGVRSYFWYGVDPRGKLAAIRPGVRENRAHETWGPAMTTAFATGPLVECPISEDIDTQLDWLCDAAPDYLLSLGHNLRSVLLRSRETGRVPNGLRALLSYADRPPEDLHSLARAIWDVPVHDTYSCIEFGPLALQCPEHGKLHVQSESALVEIINASGHPCVPGETGRVIVTGLHNFAMPLVRYDLGDYATVGEPCACGRGLPVIASINGRARNIACDPSGRRFWPLINPSVWLETPITHRQLIQHSANTIEIRYVATRPINPVEESTIADVLTRNLRHRYDFRFTKVEKIAREAGEKFEEFISLTGVE
jgi:phenylacetate-CoA ligase